MNWMDPKRVAAASISAVLLVVGLFWDRSTLAAKRKAPADEVERKNPIAADEKSLAEGKKVYTNNCAPCHGPSGKGDGPKGVDLKPLPADLSAPEVAAESDGALYWKITTGQRPMPAFKKLLPDDERWHIVNYLHTFGAGTKAKPPATSPVAAAARQEAQTGGAEEKNPVAADEKSLAEGKTIYTKNCASCHGASGKGDGPKAANMDPRPADLSSADVVAQSDAALYRRITAGRKPMPSFEKLLSDEQRWRALSYIRTFSAGNKRQPADSSSVPASDAASDPASKKAATKPTGTARPASHGEAESGDSAGRADPQRRTESGWRHFVRWAGHFHPPLTAFPIAMLLGAALAEALRLLGGGTWLEGGSRWCVIVGTLGAVVASSLGWAFATEHAGSRLLEVHRWLGTAAGCGAVVIMVLSELARRRGRPWLALFRSVLFLAVPLVVATGYFGGAMVYGTHQYQWTATKANDGLR